MGIFHFQILLRGSYFPRRAKTEKYFDMRYSKSTPCSHSGQVFRGNRLPLQKFIPARSFWGHNENEKALFFLKIRMQMALSILSFLTSSCSCIWEQGQGSSRWVAATPAMLSPPDNQPLHPLQCSLARIYRYSCWIHWTTNKTLRVMNLINTKSCNCQRWTLW